MSYNASLYNRDSEDPQATQEGMYVSDWSFVVITVNTSVHVQVFTVTSILFTVTVKSLYYGLTM